jgi:hypothetical protein
MVSARRNVDIIAFSFHGAFSQTHRLVPLALIPLMKPYQFFPFIAQMFTPQGAVFASWIGAAFHFISPHLRPLRFWVVFLLHCPCLAVPSSLPNTSVISAGQLFCALAT